MIQKETRVKATDNSGAKDLQCIHIVGSTRKRYAGLGDEIICAVKSAIPGALVKKGDVVRAVIVRARKEYSRDDGTYVRFGDNAAVIIKNDLEMVGTRIFGPVARELRARFPKILGLAPESV